MCARIHTHKLKSDLFWVPLSPFYVSSSFIWFNPKRTCCLCHTQLWTALSNNKQDETGVICLTPSLKKNSKKFPRIQSEFLQMSFLKGIILTYLSYRNSPGISHLAYTWCVFDCSLDLLSSPRTTIAALPMKKSYTFYWNVPIGILAASLFPVQRALSQ